MWDNWFFDLSLQLSWLWMWVNKPKVLASVLVRISVLNWCRWEYCDYFECCMKGQRSASSANLPWQYGVGWYSIIHRIFSWCCTYGNIVLSGIVYLNTYDTKILTYLVLVRATMLPLCFLRLSMLCGAEEVCWAHNTKVLGSKPSRARLMSQP